LDENPTGQTLADLIHKEPKILAKEVRWLQDKAWKARRRAGERKEDRNKAQNSTSKDLHAKCRSHRNDTTTTQGQDQRSYKEGHARVEISTSQTYLPETGETARQMEGPSHCGNRQSRETMDKENL